MPMWKSWVRVQLRLVQTYTLSVEECSPQSDSPCTKAQGLHDVRSSVDPTYSTSRTKEASNEKCKHTIDVHFQLFEHFWMIPSQSVENFHWGHRAWLGQLGALNKRDGHTIPASDLGFVRMKIPRKQHVSYLHGLKWAHPQHQPGQPRAHRPHTGCLTCVSLMTLASFVENYLW